MQGDNHTDIGDSQRVPARLLRVVPNAGAVAPGDPLVEARAELAVRLGEPERPFRIGDELVARGHVTRRDLERTYAEASHTGALLGELLVARGLVRRIDLYEALSDVWGIPYVDLVKTPPDTVVAEQLGLSPKDLAGQTWVPVGARGDVLLVATSEQPTVGIAATVRERSGWAGTIIFHATTEWDLRAAVLRAYGADLVRDAATGLALATPEESASRVITRSQVAVLAGSLVACSVGLVLDHGLVAALAFAIVNVGYAGNVLFKTAAVAAGLITAQASVVRRAGQPLADTDLPVYTVLVPAFGEANVIAELVGHLGALDYPPDRLQVLLLLEEVDRPTIEAALGAGLPSFVRIVVVPDGQPRTKPKACNVGLQFARGEFLVIYDAEDRPDPNQLRLAAATFRASGPELVCLQARLNYHNADENLLTRFFTVEYSHWFDLMLEGLAALRLPIPLGGTSNHFRTESLRDLGGWDPHNVTEDADLGLRAAARGFTVGTIDSTTWEEACCRVRPWIKQRTRWIKGYMQTTLVHTRHPLRFVRAAGNRASLTLVLLIAGTPLAFLAAPILWAITIFGLTQGETPFGGDGDRAAEVALFNLIGGNLLMIAISALAAIRRRRYGLAFASLLLPLYWTLHSFAAWRALVQLITRPSYWEKTPHGISKRTAPDPTAARALAEAAARAVDEAA